MLYKISNIKFEQNNYKVNIPMPIAESAYMCKSYLRTLLFETQDITYDTAPMDRMVWYTHSDATQPFDSEIVDHLTTNNYKMIEYSIELSYKPNVILYVSKTDIDAYNDSNGPIDKLDLAVYDKLVEQLDVDFIIT